MRISDWSSDVCSSDLFDCDDALSRRTPNAVAQEQEARSVALLLERAVLLQPVRSGVRAAELDDTAALAEQPAARHRRLHAVEKPAAGLVDPDASVCAGTGFDRKGDGVGKCVSVCVDLGGR